MGSAKPLAWVKLHSHQGQQGEMKMGKKERGDAGGGFYVLPQVLHSLLCAARISLCASKPSGEAKRQMRTARLLLKGTQP